MTESQSPTIGKLAEALAKAQTDFGPLRKGKANPFFKSKYADLAAVIDVIREPFAEQGLAFVQGTRAEEVPGGQFVTIMETRILHASGEWVLGSYPVLARGGWLKDKQGNLIRDKDGNLIEVPPGPQDLGSACTYARRYALQSMVGLAAEDDDGNRANGRGRGDDEDRRESPPKATAKPAPIAQREPGDGSEDVAGSEAMAISQDPAGPASYEELVTLSFPEGKGATEGIVWMRDRCRLIQGATKTWHEVLTDAALRAQLERAIGNARKEKGDPNLKWSIAEMRGAKALKLAAPAQRDDGHGKAT